MQFVLIALASILWKLAVLPLVIGLAASLLRRALSKRAHRDHPRAWRIEARARAGERARSKLWHLRGMGVLVLDASALHWRRLWPAERRTVALHDIHEALAVGRGDAGVLRVEEHSGAVHLWRLPDAHTWAAELQGRRVDPAPKTDTPQ